MSRQLLEYHPVFGHRFIPHLKARVPHEHGGYLVRTNGAGFRCNREFAPEKRPGIRRVLLFGDSFSAGDGVSNEKRYGDRLEQLVPALEVYNYALPGTGTDQQYLAYRELARGVEHDVLLVAVLVENIRRVVARYRVYVDDKGREVCYAKPYFERKNGTLVLHNVPPQREPIPPAELEAAQASFVDRGGRFAALRKIVTAVGLREVAQSLTGYQPLPDYDRPDSPAWLLLRAILEQWIQGQAQPVILMAIPLHQYVEGTADPAAYQARFREVAQATGVTLHDPLPDLRQLPAAERRRLRFERDVHPTPEGHAALAASLAPVLERVLARIRARMSQGDDDREYVVEADDWLEALAPPFRGEFLTTVRALGLDRLQRYPPPKTGGLPLGREARILSRHLSGRCAVFEPSAFSALYRQLATLRERDLYRAFVLGQTLPDALWRELIGTAALRQWIERGLLREETGGRFLRFRIYGIGPLTLIADGEKPLLLRRVVIGTDSLVHAEFLGGRALGTPLRYLDVGPGSGAVLLVGARLCAEALGLDINPRAVAVARLNAELNGMENVRAAEADIFQHAGRFGRFDLVTWNMPFMLMPERCKHTHLDAYGGRLGVEIQAQFLRLLPTLLAPGGQAVLLATTTLLESGEELLGAEIRRGAAEWGLDVDIHVRQTFWSHAFLNYQIECGVRNFESWFLVIRPGSGRIRRFERTWGVRVVDRLRGWLHFYMKSRRAA